MKYVWERLVACTTHGRGPVVASVLSQTSRMSDLLLLNSCSLFLLFLLKKIIGIQWAIYRSRISFKDISSCRTTEGSLNYFFDGFIGIYILFIFYSFVDIILRWLQIR